MVALLDLFTQYGACQSIEFFALFELRQNPGQQLPSLCTSQPATTFQPSRKPLTQNI
jgi:hypothetical protein